jgi:diguanylate cyclase (GGDEF)-like protein
MSENPAPQRATTTSARTRRFSIGAKVSLVCVLLVGANLAVAAAGAHGLGRVTAREAETYTHDLPAIRDAGQLRRDLHSAYAAALRLVATRHLDVQGQIGADLDGRIIPAVEAGLVTVRGQQARGGRDALTELDAGWQEVLELRRSGRLEAASAEPAGSLVQDELADETAALFAPLFESVDAVVADRLEEARESHTVAMQEAERSRRLLYGIALSSLLVGVGVGIWLSRHLVRRLRECAGFAREVAAGGTVTRLRPHGADELADLATTLNDMLDRRSDSRAVEERQGEFVDALHVTETEEEAHLLVKRHLERSLEGSHAVVLNRNNSADRLEAMTPVPDGSPLVGALAGAAPRSCLGVRFARGQQHGPEREPLLSCDLCGGCARTTCEPLLVGGEVIGSVLVDHPAALGAGDRATIRESVSQAAPVLANLRNLALAEFRANNDTLTGVPNKRALQDMLKQMVAQASRGVSPLAAVMLDLDHFKQVNDTHGHERGDEVLAAVGTVLRDTLREGDFVGRFGGEEFLLLLPDTDRQGATTVAETVRVAISSVTVPGLERATTASLGIAVLPDEAGDAATLLRLADRALFAAKTNGRNRIEGGVHGPPVTRAARPVAG